MTAPEPKWVNLGPVPPPEWIFSTKSRQKSYIKVRCTRCWREKTLRAHMFDPKVDCDCIRLEKARERFARSRNLDRLRKQA